ncbi:MAG TPA: hypothetical protein VEZ17_04750 [Chitinophagaceae bacterium]|jgi:hypothetical protein|nr:hypothetical protein [Chitinophagaceae bacterium]
MKSNILLFVSLTLFGIINSSFKQNIRPGNVEKASRFKKTVPFKGNISVSLSAGTTTGSGVGSHIGRFDYDSVDDFNSVGSVTGTATFTAANGDQIFTTFSGTFGDFENGIFDVTFENTITGGTGRFTGATGSFSSTGEANVIAATATTAFTGTISY